MAVWLVRAGGRGEQEQIALDNNIVTIGWYELPDLANTTRQGLAKLYREKHPDASPNRVSNHVGQVWAFVRRIAKGDLVVLPLHIQSAIAIGKVIGDYQYRTDIGNNVFHTRPVEWLQTDIPRTTFDQDILYSCGAFMTVCQITRNNAEERINTVLADKSKRPGLVSRACAEKGHSPPERLPLLPERARRACR
jgi:restriction system protein